MEGGEFSSEHPILEDTQGRRKSRDEDYAGSMHDRIIVPLLSMEEGFCRKMGVITIAFGVFSILLEFVWTPRIGPTRAIGLCLLSLGMIAVGVMLYFYKHSVQLYVRIIESAEYMRITFFAVIGTLFVCIVFATFMILDCYACAAIEGSTGISIVLMIGLCYKLCHRSNAGEDWDNLFGRRRRTSNVEHVEPIPPPESHTPIPTMTDVKNMTFTVDDQD